MKGSYGLKINMKKVVYRFAKIEAAVVLSIVMVLFSKSILPHGSYLRNFILYGCLSVIAYGAMVVILFRRETLRIIRK